MGNCKSVGSASMEKFFTKEESARMGKCENGESARVGKEREWGKCENKGCGRIGKFENGKKCENGGSTHG